MFGWCKSLTELTVYKGYNNTRENTGFTFENVEGIEIIKEII